jgi:hypothetical protein
MQYVIHFDTNNACPNVAKRKWHIVNLSILRLYCFYDVNSPTEMNFDNFETYKVTKKNRHMRLKYSQLQQNHDYPN